MFRPVVAQNGILKKFFSMHFPEKCWIVRHVFVAKAAWSISSEAQIMTKELLDKNQLDGDPDGGQIDAFRHAIWMAMLSQKIGVKKALKLGIAHEKGNRKDFDNSILEDGTVPDSISCAMDMLNNKAGVAIGISHNDSSREELKMLVQESILNGHLWVIKKNKNSQFLDWKDEVIPKESYIKKWNNPKCLVVSNYAKK